MAFTIEYFHNKFIDRIDKDRSGIIGLPQTIEMFGAGLHDFMEDTLKYIENTQLLRDLLLPVMTPYEFPLVLNGTNDKEMLASLPSDYYSLASCEVINPNVTVRKTDLIRVGELNARELNPNKRPTPEYPAVIQYQDYIVAYGALTATHVKGFYIVYPTIGNIDNDIKTEILVNLPDRSVEKILNKMVTDYFMQTGDQRYSPALNEDIGFGEPNK